MSTFPATLPLPMEVPRTPVSNVIRTDPEGGIVMTRQRYTKETWRFTYRFPKLDATQLATFMAHWDLVGEWDIFDWTYNGVTWNVRFGAPPRITDLPVEYYSVEFDMVSV